MVLGAESEDRQLDLNGTDYKVEHNEIRRLLTSLLFLREREDKCSSLLPFFFFLRGG